MAPKLVSKIQQKIREKQAEHRQEKQEHAREQAEERKAEVEAYKKERRHQIEERGRHAAQREYGTAPKSGRSHPKYSKFAGRTPVFEPVSDPLMSMAGFGRPRKPKVPVKTTTVRTGDKTITIREKTAPNEQQPPQRKKQSFLDVKDPLALDF